MSDPHETELPPDQAPAADLPTHAKERLVQMRRTHFFTSDLSVNEFLLVKQAGFEPLGLVMGSSIYRIRPNVTRGMFSGAVSGELEELTQAMYHSRELAMTRMEEEADALGADGIIGVRLDVNLHAWGKDVAEFVAVGTAVRHLGGEPYRNKHGKPFTSDLSGQDFWTLIRSGFRPAGFVMGNCVYYVAPNALASWSGSGRNAELTEYTHHFYDARELAIERLQEEAEELEAQGIVGVTVTDQQHSWRGAWGAPAPGTFAGEVLEFFVIGTAVVANPTGQMLPVPTLAIPVDK
jgi:uncharacterized protein YbjQ (UPF0145 family)